MENSKKIYLDEFEKLEAECRDNLLAIRHKKYGYRRYFETSKTMPEFPLLGVGNLDHVCWDISTMYAIDANKNCWMDNAHGHPMEIVSAGDLLAEAKDEHDRIEIREILGLKPEMPRWMKDALANKWTPPDGIDFSIYEDK